MTYSVKTSIYEGPFEVLLELIESRKLFVNEISLAQITDDFIKYIESHPDFPIDQSSEFILIASALLLIKSKSLLPNLQLTEEETASIEELESRLAHYKLIKDLTVHIKESFGKTLMFSKSTGTRIDTMFLPDTQTSVTHLLQSMKDVLSRIVETEKIPQATVRKIISLEDMITTLLTRVQKNMSLRFSEFAGIGKTEIGREEKVHVIVSFLAMLELVKRGVIMAKQDTQGGEIEINNDTVSIPSYG